MNMYARHNIIRSVFVNVHLTRIVDDLHAFMTVFTNLSLYRPVFILFLFDNILLNGLLRNYRGEIRV